MSKYRMIIPREEFDKLIHLSASAMQVEMRRLECCFIDKNKIPSDYEKREMGLVNCDYVTEWVRVA